MSGFLGNKTFLFIIFLQFFVLLVPTKNLLATEFVSFNQYQTKAIPVQNPVDLTQLKPGSTFQVNTTGFIIQFFFNGKNINGIVLKRDKRYPIHIRWCFIRSCEHSLYDYKSVLAQAYQKPFNEDPFQVRLPVKFNYNFQGLHFTNGLPPFFVD